jgi:23S rRNA pseudouridine955/2504/2580 synthase
MIGPIKLMVSPAEAGQKLVQYLGRVLGKDVPGSVFMRWIRTGQVRVDGKRAKPFDRLEEGQCVRLPPFAQMPAGETTTPLDLDVLAETGDWLVIAKPSGLPVHPGSGWTDSVQTRLGAAYAGSAFIPSIAHRLDKNTSGVLLAAKTHRALTLAHEAFKGGRTVKEYLCWVRGKWALSPVHAWAELEDRIEKSGAHGQEKMRVGAGREARLAATPLLVEADRTLLRVRLFTGRTHQIRAQLSSRGHPVVGDSKYGGGNPPMFLHAWRLTIADDTFECPPPWAGEWATALESQSG